MTIKQFLERAKSAQLSNQSQVWPAGMLADTINWIEVAALVLKDVAGGQVPDRGLMAEVKGLLDQLED